MVDGEVLSIAIRILNFSNFILIIFNLLCFFRKDQKYKFEKLRICFLVNQTFLMTFISLNIIFPSIFKDRERANIIVENYIFPIYLSFNFAFYVPLIYSIKEKFIDPIHIIKEFHSIFQNIKNEFLLGCVFTILIFFFRYFEITKDFDTYKSDVNIPFIFSKEIISCCLILVQIIINVWQICSSFILYRKLIFDQNLIKTYLWFTIDLAMEIIFASALITSIVLYLFDFYFLRTETFTLQIIITILFYSKTLLQNILSLLSFTNSDYFYYSFRYSEIGRFLGFILCKKKNDPIISTEEECSFYDNNETNKILQNSLGLYFESYQISTFDSFLKISLILAKEIYKSHLIKNSFQLQHDFLRYNICELLTKNDYRNIFELNSKSLIKICHSSTEYNSKRNVENKNTSLQTLIFSSKCNHEVKIEAPYIDKFMELSLPNIKSFISKISSKFLRTNQFGKHCESYNKLSFNEKNLKKQLEIKVFDDQFIVIFLRNNKYIKNYIKNYVSYNKSMNPHKNVSFLQLIIGVFTINLNPFNEITLLIITNLIVSPEYLPRDSYNYWQIYKICSEDNTDSNILKIISSSKSHSNLIKNPYEIILQNHKIQLIDFDNFVQSLICDLNFLKNCGCHYFDITVLMYEIGKINKLDNSTLDENFSKLKLRLSHLSKYSAIYYQSNSFEENQNNSYYEKNASGSKSNLDALADFCCTDIFFKGNLFDYQCVFFFIMDNTFAYQNDSIFNKIYSNLLCCKNSHTKFMNKINQVFSNTEL